MTGPWMLQICVTGAWSGETRAHLNKAPWLTIQYTASNNTPNVVYDEKIDPLLARHVYLSFNRRPGVRFSSALGRHRR